MGERWVVVCRARGLYLDVPDELLGGGLDGHLAVDGPLYGGRPPHGLIQHLGVEAVRVLTPVDDDVPVACVKAEGRQTEWSIHGILTFDMGFRVQTRDTSLRERHVLHFIFGHFRDAFIQNAYNTHTYTHLRTDGGVNRARPQPSCREQLVAQGHLDTRERRSRGSN